MSALTEYIKLLPRALKNADKIIEGMRNQLKIENGTLPKETEDIIIGRRLICSQCPYNSTNAVAAGLHKTDRADEYCIHCGCNIVVKTASLLANCGIEAHNVRNPDNQLPLKWEKHVNNES